MNFHLARSSSGGWLVIPARPQEPLPKRVVRVDKARSAYERFKQAKRFKW